MTHLGLNVGAVGDLLLAAVLSMDLRTRRRTAIYRCAENLRSRVFAFLTDEELQTRSIVS